MSFNKEQADKVFTPGDRSQRNQSNTMKWWLVDTQVEKLCEAYMEKSAEKEVENVGGQLNFVRSNNERIFFLNPQHGFGLGPSSVLGKGQLFDFLSRLLRAENKLPNQLTICFPYVHGVTDENYFDYIDLENDKKAGSHYTGIVLRFDKKNENKHQACCDEIKTLGDNPSSHAMGKSQLSEKLKGLYGDAEIVQLHSTATRYTVEKGLKTAVGQYAKDVVIKELRSDSDTGLIKQNEGNVCGHCAPANLYLYFSEKSAPKDLTGEQLAEKHLNGNLLDGANQSNCFGTSSNLYQEKNKKVLEEDEEVSEKSSLIKKEKTKGCCIVS